jgi:hypothetical protein
MARHRDGLAARQLANTRLHTRTLVRHRKQAFIGSQRLREFGTRCAARSGGDSYASGQPSSHGGESGRGDHEKDAMGSSDGREGRAASGEKATGVELDREELEASLKDAVQRAVKATVKGDR